MNIVIPQNYQEAQQFYQNLQSLTQEQLMELKKIYEQQGIKLIIKIGTKEAFDIIGSNVDCRFWQKGQHGNYLYKDDHSMRMYDPDGTVAHFDKNQKYHRIDGPAIEDPVHGNKWLVHGTPVETLIGIFQRYVKFKVDMEMDYIKTRLRFYLLPLEDEGVIKSFIEFLSDNGYQFDEYLNDYKTKSFDIEHFEPLLQKITPKSENKIMKIFKDFYIADRVRNIAKSLSEGNKEENILEAMQNLDLIQGKPSIEEIFHNWKSYDEIQESFSLKSFWSYN